MLILFSNVSALSVIFLLKIIIIHYFEIEEFKIKQKFILNFRDFQYKLEDFLQK